jgi:hypothetical protein
MLPQRVPGLQVTNSWGSKLTHTVGEAESKQLGHPTSVISEGAAERADGTGGVLGGGGRSAQAQQRARRLESGLVACAQHTPSSGFDNKNTSKTMLWIWVRSDSELSLFSGSGFDFKMKRKTNFATL